MAITLVPKRHSLSDRPGTNHPGSEKARISALIWSLRCFDPTTIEHRDDWKANAFATLINTTLADIFGQTSQEYEEYSIQSLTTLPSDTEIDYPLPELIQGYQRGIKAAVKKLNLLLDALDKKPGATEGVPEPVPQARATDASWINEKVSLVTMRAKLGTRHAPSVMLDATAPGHRKRALAKPVVGVTPEGVIDAQLDKPQSKEGMAEARSRGNADIAEKNKKKQNQRRVDKADAVREKRKTKPITFGQDEDLLLEYFEAMLSAREAEELRKEGSAKDESETAAVGADEETSVAMDAVVIAADDLGAATIPPGTRKDEDPRPLEPEGFLSPGFSYQEPCAEPLSDKPFRDETGMEALVAVDAAIVVGNYELPETGSIKPSTKDSRLFAAVQEGLETAINEEPSGEIPAEPHHKVVHIDRLPGKFAEPQSPSANRYRFGARNGRVGVRNRGRAEDNTPKPRCEPDGGNTC